MANQPYGPDPRYQRAQEPTEPMPYSEQTYVQGSADGEINRQSVHESYVDPSGRQVERREEVYEDPELRRANARYWVAAVIWFLLTLLEIILGLRFLFRLLAANSYNGFVSGLYSFTYIFIAPFVGIFGNPGLKAHVFEVSTLIAMIIYALIAWALVALSRIVFAPPLTGGRSSFTMRRQRRQP
jgi:hypothetical protein